MATLTRVRRVNAGRAAVAKGRANAITKWKPRRCMVISMSLILAGLVIPLLMAVHLLPITFLLGFVTLILLGTGAIQAIIRCGEI